MYAREKVGVCCARLDEAGVGTRLGHPGHDSPISTWSSFSDPVTNGCRTKSERPRLEYAAKSSGLTTHLSTHDRAQVRHASWKIYHGISAGMTVSLKPVWSADILSVGHMPLVSGRNGRHLDPDLLHL